MRWFWLIWIANFGCAQAADLTGTVTDPAGKPVANATVSLLRRVDSSRFDTQTDLSGTFELGALPQGAYRLTAKSPGFPIAIRSVEIGASLAYEVGVQFATTAAQAQSLTVIADAMEGGLFSPDPAQRILIRDETLDANPGRPGMPVSIPGMPAESPAGGVKPPQYFAPGVAGDHGEPVAMFFQVGGFLYPNNLPANAHGNGYADPNVILPIAIESIATDGAAFNVREGNNAVNSAIVFGLRDRIEPLVRVTADYRDVNVVTGWSPVNPANKSWVGLELSFGNGYLDRLEHRRQYKSNVSKVFTLGRHNLTVYGIGYYGKAFQPGLVPIDRKTPGDTYDARQQEETANGSLILNDVWQLTSRRQVQLSGFYRYYVLDVRPNFGDGLIRQSEHRNVHSEDVLYAERYHRRFSLLAGANFRRERPSALDLDRGDELGMFHPVTANNLLLNFKSPFVSADGAFGFVHYNAGFRRDDVSVDNQDLYRPEASFHRKASVNSPKGTISLIPSQPIGHFLPQLSFSYGQAFHVNDPRIGTTAIKGGTIISKARSYQLVAMKVLGGTELRATLAHVTTAQQLARISTDTGLQQDEGPGLIRSLTLTARRNFRFGFVQTLYARADARDRLTGEPTPEAPRLIWDVLGTVDHLPFGIVARGEYEHVGIKPLGDGFQAVPVKEFRGAVLRPFPRQGVDLGVNFLLVSGYGGQTLEIIALPGEGEPFERVTGFPLRSYVSLSVTYHFRRGNTR